MLLIDLTEKKLIQPPSWLPHNTCYLTIIGSTAYGIAEDNSDMDICGIAIPRKEMVFPHLGGVIRGFGNQGEEFKTWQQKVFDPDAVGGKGREYDFHMYGIVHFFQLLLESNPNSIESLFVPQECIIHITQAGSLMRDNRKMFLSKDCFTRFKNYAFAQLKKLKSKNPTGKRLDLIERFGFDVKFAYNLVRLLSECEQIMMYEDMDLRKYKEHLKAIRRGDVKEDEIIRWASEKELHLEKMFAESKIQDKLDEGKIKNLLINCLESQYGNLNTCINIPDKYFNIVNEIGQIFRRYGV